MKRILLVIITLVMTIIIIPASAHPGRTDSSGGHTDRSTGEYHYHHGYSAHQHTDGVCPYDFDDKTGINSGDSSGGSSGSVRRIPFSADEPSTPIPTTPASTTPSPTEKPKKQWGNTDTIALILLSVLPLGGMTFIFLSIFLDKPKPELKKKRVYIPPSIIIPELLCGGIPKGVSLDDDWLPYVNERLYGYGKRYNAYITKNGRCYHRNNCKGLSSNKRLIHVYRAIDLSYLTPCSKCKPRSKKDDWYIEMFSIEKF